MKPHAPIIGADGNIFNILGIASRTLESNGIDPTEMKQRVMSSKSYTEALAVILEYVEPMEADI